MSERQSARMRALGEELTNVRKRAKHTTRTAAPKVGMSIATLNRLELGTRLGTPAEVSALLAIYGVTGSERKRIMALVDEATMPGWLDHKVDQLLVALSNFEGKSSDIFNFAPSIIPGLLQTRRYAEAVISGAVADQARATSLLEARLKRQEVLSKPVLRYRAVIDEAAVRRPYGGIFTMAEQIHDLIMRAKQPNIDLHVIPFRHGGYQNPGHFSLLDFRAADSLVYLENGGASGFLHEDGLVSLFQTTAATLVRTALGSADSVNFLLRIAADYERS